MSRKSKKPGPRKEGNVVFPEFGKGGQDLGRNAKVSSIEDHPGYEPTPELQEWKDLKTIMGMDEDALEISKALSLIRGAPEIFGFDGDDVEALRGIWDSMDEGSLWGCLALLSYHNMMAGRDYPDIFEEEDVVSALLSLKKAEGRLLDIVRGIASLSDSERIRDAARRLL